MKLVGVLAWYEENPTWLAASVASFARLGMDHLVAVDGSYALFPDGTPRSGAEQHEALAEIVRPFGMGLTLHVPNEVWDSEVDKRTFSFALAETLTNEDDWYVVFDADEIAEVCDAKQALSATDKLVGECVSWERLGPEEARASGRSLDSKPVRRFYRALRGLKVDRTHTTYRAGNLTLRGYGADDLVEAEMLPMQVEHRWNFHDPQRRLRQETYYRLREMTGLEQRTCAKCERDAVMTAPTNFHPTEERNERVDVSCNWIEVCESHLPEVVADNEARLMEIGVDPDSTLERLGFDLRRARWFAERATAPEAPAARAA
jgi:hypothetical protein